jgi:hypothetical protein
MSCQVFRVRLSGVHCGLRREGFTCLNGIDFKQIDGRWTSLDEHSGSSPIWGSLAHQHCLRQLSKVPEPSASFFLFRAPLWFPRIKEDGRSRLFSRKGFGINPQGCGTRGDRCAARACLAGMVSFGSVGSAGVWAAGTAGTSSVSAVKKCGLDLTLPSESVVLMDRSESCGGCRTKLQSLQPANSKTER